MLVGESFMPRKITPAQLKSKLRQIENQQKRAVSQFNQAVRKYNQEARAHNSRVRANRAKINSELAKLQRQSTTRYTVFSTSVYSLHRAYVQLENRADVDYVGEDYLLDLSEQETANSLQVMNALLQDEVEQGEQSEDLRSTKITSELQKISQDLDNRWRGAIYSLSPQNPDAARHFCTSAREIFTQIFEVKAPDQSVLEILPDCEVTDRGTPTRRAKIEFLLRRKGMTSEELEEFVEQDVENILQLFRVFNDGTHESSVRFDLGKLISIKKRVEDGIIFLATIVDN
jgi:hypothetical protein